MLANSLADVVAEEAAKRLPLDVNLERKAKKAERIGIGVAKRLALIQADIWAKRGATGDIYELEPLVLKKRAQGLPLGRWWTNSLSKAICSFVTTGSEMQSLQHVPRQQTIQFLEPNSLCPGAMCSRSRLPIQKQEKTAQ